VRNLTITIILAITSFLHIGIGYAAESRHKEKTHRQQKRLKVNPVTEYENVWTANAETNVYRIGTFENITVEYSATNGWDYSLTLLNAQLLGSNRQVQGDAFFNIGKTFDINTDFSIVAGAQNGFAVINVQQQLWLSFAFLDNRYDVTPWLLIHAGPYLANAAITGTSRQVGFMTGTEITFIQNKLSLQMDYVSGHQSLSGATVNMLFNITPRCQIYMGVSVPEQNSGNEFAGIVGFNLSTKNL
jgi:hypothetical protein